MEDVYLFPTELGALLLEDIHINGNNIIRIPLFQGLLVRTRRVRLASGITKCLWIPMRVLWAVGSYIIIVRA